MCQCSFCVDKNKKNKIKCNNVAKVRSLSSYKCMYRNRTETSFSLCLVFCLLACFFLFASVRRTPCTEALNYSRNVFVTTHPLHRLVLLFFQHGALNCALNYARRNKVDVFFYVRARLIMRSYAPFLLLLFDSFSRMRMCNSVRVILKIIVCNQSRKLRDC